MELKLTAETLSKLPSGQSAKDYFVQDFVRSQRQYTSTYAREGQKILQRWNLDMECGIVQEPCARTQYHLVGSKGFPSPVLRPRNPCGIDSNTSWRSPVIEFYPDTVVSPNKKANSTNVKHGSHTEECGRSPLSAKSSKTICRPSTIRKPTYKPVHPTKAIPSSSGKRREERSAKRKTTDSEDETNERLAQRRARRRQKKEIMNPQQEPHAKIPSSKLSVVVDTRTTQSSTKKREIKRKDKLPAGLTLMHGFNAKNIAKHRLIISAAPIQGVFSKGRASNKSKISQKSITLKDGFDETFFLREKSISRGNALINEGEKLIPSDSPNTDTVSDTRTVQTLSSAIHKEPKLDDQEQGGMHVSKESAPERSPGGSMIWDIEKEFLPEQSQKSDAGCAPKSIIMDTKTYDWSPVPITPARTAPDHRESLNFDKASTLAPSQSASQINARNGRYHSHDLQTSKYFTVLDRNFGEEIPDSLIVPPASGASAPAACKSTLEKSGPEKGGKDIEFLESTSDSAVSDVISLGSADCRASLAENTPGRNLSDGITALYNGCTTEDPRTYADGTIAHPMSLLGTAVVTALSNAASEDDVFHTSGTTDQLFRDDCIYANICFSDVLDRFACDESEALCLEDVSISDAIRMQSQLCDQDVSLLQDPGACPFWQHGYDADSSQIGDIEQQNMQEFDTIRAGCENLVPEGTDPRSNSDQNYRFYCDFYHTGDVASGVGSSTSLSDYSESRYSTEVEEPRQPFTEGRVLLRSNIRSNISSISHQVGSLKSRENNLSSVELQVANEIQGHWHPVKL